MPLTILLCFIAGYSKKIHVPIYVLNERVLDIGQSFLFALSEFRYVAIFDNIYFHRCGGEPIHANQDADRSILIRLELETFKLYYNIDAKNEPNMEKCQFTW